MLTEDADERVEDGTPERSRVDCVRPSEIPRPVARRQHRAEQMVEETARIAVRGLQRDPDDTHVGV